MSVETNADAIVNLTGINESIKTINESIKTLNQSNDKKLNSDDFIITTESVKLETNIQYGSASKSTSYTHVENTINYRPLGLCGGYYMSAPAGSNSNKGSDRYCSQNWTVQQVYASSITNSSITIFAQAHSNPNHENIHDEIQINYKILWVKIK